SLSFETWKDRAVSAKHMQRLFASMDALHMLVEEIVETFAEFIQRHPIAVSDLEVRRAAEYLVEELARERLEFITSKYAVQLVELFKQSLDDETLRHYQEVATKMQGWPAERWNLTNAWLQALVK